MRINILHPDSGWILSNIAKKTEAANPEVFAAITMNEFKDSEFSDWADVDAWLYCDIQNCYIPLIKEYYPLAVHIGLFTHLDKDSTESYRAHWGSLDGVVHMAERYFQSFADHHFYPVDRMTVLRPGEVSQFSLKKMRLGVCQRGEHPGKGAEFLPEVLNSLPADVADALVLYTLGSGWNSDMSVTHIDCGDENYEDYPEFYQNIDYLLIPSLWEGGPMSLLEAMATGLPIIAPDVGWVPEILRELTSEIDIEGKEIDSFVDGVSFYRPSNFWLYKPGDVQGLTHIINSIVSVRLAKRRVVEDMSYKGYGDGLIEFTNHLKELHNGAFS